MITAEKKQHPLVGEQAPVVAIASNGADKLTSPVFDRYKELAVAPGGHGLAVAVLNGVKDRSSDGSSSFSRYYNLAAMAQYEYAGLNNGGR